MRTTRRHGLLLAVIIMVAFLMQSVIDTRTEAASAKSSNASYVKLVNKNGGLAGISAKKRSNIKSTITRWEFCRIMKNLYGGRINLAANWIDDATLTQAWACNMMSVVSKQMGVTVKWSGGSSKSKVNLGVACKLIVSMANVHAKLRPTKWVA